MPPKGCLDTANMAPNAALGFELPGDPARNKEHILELTMFRRDATTAGHLEMLQGCIFGWFSMKGNQKEANLRGAPT